MVERANSLVATAKKLTSDQYIAIALPGRLFRPVFADRGLAPVMLSRALGDSATVTSPLIPWNSCGAYMAATLGVSTASYFAFSFFNLANTLITILFAVFGLRVIATPGAANPELRQSAEQTNSIVTDGKYDKYASIRKALVLLRINK